MRKPTSFLCFVLIALILSSCSNAQVSDNVTSNPGSGMQVATLSSKPGLATAGPVQATPLVPQNPGNLLLMQDDFSNPGSGWETGSNEYGRVDYDSGSYLVEALIEKEYYWGVAGVDYTDIRIDVDVVVDRTAANQNDAFGVDCRVQSNGDGYGFRISSDGFAGIVLFENQEGRVLLEWIEADAILTDGSTNHLTAICEGNHFSFLVNDEFVAEVFDDTFSSGDIALSALSYEAEPITVRFDNLLVQDVENP